MAGLDEWLDAEEHFLAREKKRKGKQNKTRQRLSSREDSRALRGRVLALAPQQVLVRVGERTLSCQVKKTVRPLEERAKNLLVVGDWVRVVLASETVGVITSIEPRTSFLARRDSFSERKKHLIAVNVDQVFITLSVVEPPFAPLLIDRYIIATKQGNMAPLIIVNKVDLLETDQAVAERERLEHVCHTLTSLGLPLFRVSTRREATLAPIKEAMRGKTSVFSGPSGVGKSALINAVTSAELAVGAVAAKTKRGRHTTTAATLVPLAQGGFCIDTPGLQSFSLWGLQSGEIRTYFPDFASFAEHCRFPDCTHCHEPDCAVKEAVENGEIASFRYASYQELIADPAPKEWD